MKMLNIFWKNLKTVSRSPSYFVVLFICPLILILISGAMLNSSKFTNIRVGIINEDESYSLNLGDIKNINYYPSIGECLYDLTNYETSICIHITKAETRQMNIYLDNTKKVIEYYSKQFVLQNVLSDQSNALERSSEQLNARLVVYSTSIQSAKAELSQVKNELDEQEIMLVEYRNNLTIIRGNFDSAYFALKGLQGKIDSTKIALRSSNLAGIKSDFDQRENDINNNIAAIKQIISLKLIPADYSLVSGRLDNITLQLNSIHNSLENAQQNNQDVLQILDSISLINSELDSIKATLDKMDSDLALAIERTQNSKVRIDAMAVKLDEASEEISSLSESMPSALIFSFNNAFPLPDDPTFIAFPLLITIIITFTSLVLSNMFTLKQVNQPSYIKENISPARDVNFLVADYLINLFFVSIQVIVLFVIGVYWFNIPVGIFSTFALAILLTASIFIFIGMSIGHLIKSQSLSMLLTIFLVMLLFIFSDLLIPSVLTGSLIRFFVGLNPFMILNRILTDVLLLQKDLASQTEVLSRLFVFLILFIVICYSSRKIGREDVSRKWVYRLVILVSAVVALAVLFWQFDFSKVLLENLDKIDTLTSKIPSPPALPS